MSDDEVPDVVRVSERSYRDLDRIKDELGLNSMDAAIREAILRSPLAERGQPDTEGADELKAK